MKKLFMPLATIVLGLLLNFVGILSFMLSDGKTTALIPAFVGGAFLILGGMACNAKLRRHAIHGALVLSLVLGAYCLYKIPMLLIAQDTALKMFSFGTTAVACVVYIVLGVRSFRQARIARKDADQAVKAAEQATTAAEV